MSGIAPDLAHQVAPAPPRNEGGGSHHAAAAVDRTRIARVIQDTVGAYLSPAQVAEVAAAVIGVVRRRTD